jgi:DNA polymerase III sliding clamp (beta) subunit (PCNA family)
MSHRTLGVVSRAVSARGAVQVLGRILVQTEDDHPTLAATDMEISIRATLAGEIEGGSHAIVPGGC